MTGTDVLGIAPAAIILAGCLAACSRHDPPRADYVIFCRLEFKIARDMVQDELRQINEQRPWMPVADYVEKFGKEPPLESRELTRSIDGEWIAVRAQAPMPDNLIEQERSINQTHERIGRLAFVLGTKQVGDVIVFADPLPSLDEQNRYNSRMSQLIAAGATAEDILPKLEACYRRLK